MLSYRHSFHAGNHADVLKHIVVVELLDYLTRKDKRLWYIDTHAGAGMYRLDDEGAVGRSEHVDGIARLWSAPDVPNGLVRYMDIVRRFNRDGKLKLYPGSPRFAHEQIRRGDRLWLSELHPRDHATLEAEFRRDIKNTRVVREDGFRYLQSLLPPEPRRALIMIDPSYETRDDYTQVVSAVRDARARFASGVYAVWYPQLFSDEANALPAQLIEAAGDRWLKVDLNVRKGRDQHSGLFGSGMFIINPPHTLPAFLNANLPWLVTQLSQDDTAGYSVDSRIP